MGANEKVDATFHPEEKPEILTPGEVAELFDVDPKTVTRWAKTGKLKSFRTLGGHRRFLMSDVLVALQAAQNKGP